MEQRGAPFDLTLIVFEIDGQLSLTFRYNVDLFEASTVVHMADCFTTLLQGIAGDPDCLVSELPLVPHQPTRQAACRLERDRDRLPRPGLRSPFDRTARGANARGRGGRVAARAADLSRTGPTCQSTCSSLAQIGNWAG